MYIAMNRFQIKHGEEETFEKIWRERETHLDQVPGFKAFNLLRGPTGDDHTLYASHTQWESQAAFDAWTRSEAFRKAHANAASPKGIYLGPPRFEGFESVLSQEKG
ncbi:antibiotic biosynthesis monooxygenase [Motiliproteus sp. SC1-56]|uniref:antibiotic biosynthesis monooxygenase family protein n=1 Tax=Motiliproteus sp. SC1-56 TaxID=2799565 RepID=UPI001A8FED63|nr:antibiotic biosynthesis monooxygenase [Motiliproteus sp. SC1-56]